MATIELRRDGGVSLLIADLIVLYFALSVALDEDVPTLWRLAFFAVAGLAIGLGSHSVFSILRRTRRSSPR